MESGIFRMNNGTSTSGKSQFIVRKCFPLVEQESEGESESEGHSVVSDSLRPHGQYSPWNSPGQNTGVDNLSLFQASNRGLPHCRRILYQLSHKGSPRILEWVAYPFSSRSFWPRNRIGVSCISGSFLTNWAMREAQWRRSEGWLGPYDDRH